MFELSETWPVSKYDMGSQKALHGDLAIDPVTGRLLRSRPTGLLADPRGEFIAGLVPTPDTLCLSSPVCG